MECCYSCRLGLRSDASRPNRVGEGKSDRQHCNTCGDQAGINSNQAFDAATYGVFFSASAHPALSLSHAKEHRTEQLRQESAGLFSNRVTKLNERCGRGCLTTSEPTVGPTHFGSRGLKSRRAWQCCDVLRGGRTPFLNERGLLTPRATSGYSFLVRAHSVSGGSVCAAPTSTLARRCRRFYQPSRAAGQRRQVPGAADQRQACSDLRAVDHHRSDRIRQGFFSVPSAASAPMADCSGSSGPIIARMGMILDLCRMLRWCARRQAPNVPNPMSATAAAAMSLRGPMTMAAPSATWCRCRPASSTPSPSTRAFRPCCTRTSTWAFVFGFRAIVPARLISRRWPSNRSPISIHGHGVVLGPFSKRWPVLNQKPV